MAKQPLTQQLLDYVLKQYGTQPEYLWKSHPDYAVLRHGDNRKWYAIVMNVEKNALGLSGAGKMPIMNVKCSPEMLSLFLSQAGFLPAYHMNKNHWLTVLLDGSVDKETILFLLNASFDLTASRQAKKQLGIARYTEWIVPANPKYYDVEKDLREGGELHWKQSNNIAVDDIVYMYVTEPTGAIRYKCLVLEVNIPYRKKRTDNLQVKRVMKIRCLKEYDKTLIPRAKMAQFGVTAVRGPRHMPYALKQEIALLSGEGER
ncbi:MmcQ/YjbR family DNA-binding protein [Aggregatibacter actinomycetemcomitans]|uniref:MmcQ/YjbR family DNA-binding protein n=1 Tax=Aggregatibacter actinomycetemcomitans TaxID=714 RepID=UPI0011D6135E|nr:MmcQ/YjbR family DNA-binding protein [Aggregatibacter actinomycetemcomitans]TYB13286.1 MmcQ/YjbR family DNA-binding protein [Aggregatibacter actinomycetemcomitans]